MMSAKPQDQYSDDAEPPFGGEAFRPRFVIQRHQSRHPHDDFRLEVGGVFRSWAIPKFFPMNPGEKRLAIQTEDHSLDFGDFEGALPEGHAGAGSIRKFDEGWYSPCGEQSIEEQLAAGEASFCLYGHKVHGHFQLILLRRGRWRAGTGKPEWLIVMETSGAFGRP